jgi:hypothetical protein
MNQQWCDDFDLASANITNATASRDGDVTSDVDSGDTLDSNDDCSHITDAQLDANAIGLYWDTDDATINLAVTNPYGGTGQKKAFYGVMGATSSGDTDGTTVQNWSAYSTALFANLCIWLMLRDLGSVGAGQ